MTDNGARVGWFKQKEGNTFSLFKQLTKGLRKAREVIIVDIDGDGDKVLGSARSVILSLTPSSSGHRGCFSQEQHNHGLRANLF